MKRAAWPVLLASALGLAVLLSLGTWQVQRLAWKQGLIDRIESQMAAAPTPYLAGRMQGEEDYQKLSLTGHYSASPPLRFMATRQGAAGWRLLHRFELEGGGSLLVDRGVAQEAQMPPAPLGPVTVVGVSLRHNQGKGLFDPDNDTVANQWFWWDLKAMATTLGMDPTRDTRFVLRLLPDQPGSEGMFVEAPRVELRNNHLGYAITWFGLAAVLVVMTAAYLYQNRRSAG